MSCSSWLHEHDQVMCTQAHGNERLGSLDPSFFFCSFSKLADICQDSGLYWIGNSDFFKTIGIIKIIVCWLFMVFVNTSFSIQAGGNGEKEWNVKMRNILPWNTLFSKSQLYDWICLANRVNNMPVFFKCIIENK